MSIGGHCNHDGSRAHWMVSSTFGYSFTFTYASQSSFWDGCPESAMKSAIENDRVP